MLNVQVYRYIKYRHRSRYIIYKNMQIMIVVIIIELNCIEITCKIIINEKTLKSKLHNFYMV